MTAFALECASYFIPAMYYISVHYRIFNETKKNMTEDLLQSRESRQSQNYESFIELN